jgi:hypothetical protein
MQSTVARRLVLGSAAVLVAGGSVLASVSLAGGAAHHGRAAQPPAQAYTTATNRHCFGLYPAQGTYGQQFYYAPGCYGHDEPQIDPISSAANTAQSITWTVVLPADSTTAGGRQVVDLGPTFWFGALAHDASSLNAEAFIELQFYPDSTLTSPYCGSDGSFFVTHTPNKYTACSPAWAVNPSSFAEYAAFNARLKDGTSVNSLVMSAGDTVTVHFFKGTQAGTPFNVKVTDVTTGHSGTIVYTGGADGALSPAVSANTPSNFLRWGIAAGTPFSLSWEIGHPNLYTYPLAPECLPGMFNCFGYSVAQGWLQTSPLQIKSVIFLASTQPSSWGVTDGQGGSQEDVVYCGKYNAVNTCTFPWYSLNGTDKAIVSGGSYPGTSNAYGSYTQFPTTTGCTGPYGPIYCNHTLQTGTPIP